LIVFKFLYNDHTSVSCIKSSKSNPNPLALSDFEPIICSIYSGVYIGCLFSLNSFSKFAANCNKSPAQPVKSAIIASVAGIRVLLFSTQYKEENRCGKDINLLYLKSYKLKSRPSLDMLFFM